MTQEMLPTLTLNESSERFAATRSKLQALRYGNLSRVLVDLDEHRHVPIKPNRNRNRGGAQAEIAELREHVATLKAEYERLIDRVTDDLEGFADRIGALESRARQPWWKRALGHPCDQPRHFGRKAMDRLRTIYPDRESTDKSASLG
jgi:hypothetical protein